MSDSDEIIEDISSRFLKGLKVLIPDVYLKEKILMIKEHVFTETMFNEVLIVVNKIMGRKDKVKILDTDDEMTLKMKRMQERFA
jgi:hypothetical protein